LAEDVTTTVVVDGNVGLTGARPKPLGEVATVEVPATDPADECWEMLPPPPDLDPALFLASGEIPEQRRRDRKPMES
jgi:hypothetical protein